MNDWDTNQFTVLGHVQPSLPLSMTGKLYWDTSSPINNWGGEQFTVLAHVQLHLST